MNRVLKRMIIVTLALLIVTLPLLKATAAKEKTLGEYKKDLAQLEENLRKNQSETTLTKDQINEINRNIEAIKAEIEQSNKDIENLFAEIEKLNKDIEKKSKEIKSIVNFVQVANGESAYMEYIFGAKSFTDFIYRLAVSEQMASYNDKLIDEYNEMISKNMKKQEELKQKQAVLETKQQALEVENAKLGQKLSDLGEGQQDLAAQIKTSKEAIAGFDKRCKDSETPSACYTRLNPPVSNGGGSTGGNIVTSGPFIRPLTSGTVTSEYNSGRPHPTLGGVRFHTGIDISASGSSVPVYPSASGRVGAIIRKASCGGNQIYIYHNIGGKTYTSGYMHLRSINVSVGQTVNTNTVIATMGGNPSIEYWDKCSTGQHLHFLLATGLYYTEYSDYNTFLAHTFNPRNMISFPATGKSFAGR